MRHADEVRLLVSRAYFGEVRTARRLLTVAMEELERQRSLLEPMGITVADIVHGGARLTFADRVVDIQALVEDYADALERWQAVEAEARTVIASCGSDEGAACLRLYYLHGYDWADVCKAMRYGRTAVYQIARAALIECYDKVPEEWKRTLPNAEL